MKINHWLLGICVSFFVLSIFVFTPAKPVIASPGEPGQISDAVPGHDAQMGVFTSCDAVTEIPSSECAALVALYDSTVGANWTNHNFWKISDTPCSWQGVGCESGHVGFLDLQNNNLTGSLPTELGTLYSLHSLNLSYNNLSGGIPTSLGGLTQLTFMDLHRNQLTGGIPTELGNMASIWHLYLSNNQLNGPIPTSLGNLSSLITLNLSYNQLTGGIPAQLGLLSNLEYLVLSGNTGLGGGIPSELGSLTKLKQLSIRDAALTGSIPTQLGSLADLIQLELNFNQLTGSIPTQLGSLSNLIILYLHCNQLEGVIPTQLGNLTKLDSLYLHNNQLTGPIPSELGGLTKLVALSLHSNQLDGSIPASLGNLTDLQYLYFSNNLLTGNIPPELGGLTKLTALSLNINQLDGAIPASLGNLTDLQYLYLSNNLLTGNIPPELGQLTKLVSLALSGNQLSGSLPAELGGMTTLMEVYLTENQLSGPLPLSLTAWNEISIFQYSNTNICEPADADFQAWLTAILYRTGTWTCLSAPTLVSPAHLKQIQDATPWLKWNALTGAVTYQLMVDNNSGFISPEYNVTGLAGTSKTVTTVLAEGAYYWRVRANDVGGNWSPWSTRWKFTVDTTPPAKPVLLTPLNGSTTNDRTPTFTWKGVTGATKYQLMIDDNSNFSSPVFTSGELSVKSKTLGTALAPKLYYWRVRSRDAAGNWSAWSAAWKVTIK